MQEMPASDKECVGCGYCCINNPCAYGKYRHPGLWDNHCPELEWTGQRYVCCMMSEKSKMGSFYRELLNVGQGCPACQNPWRADVRERRDGK